MKGRTTRLRTLSIAGALLALALLAVSCGTQYRQEALRSEASLKPIQCVAVMPFDNLTPYPNAGLIISDLVASEMYRSREFQVMERFEVESKLGEANIELPVQVDEVAAKSLGERLGVDGVLYGSVSEFWYPNSRPQNVTRGDEPAVGVNARLVDANTGEVVWSASVSRSSFDWFTDQRDPVSRISQLAVADMLHPLFGQLGARQVDLLTVCGRQPKARLGAASGKILDKKTGQPIPGAKLVVKSPREVAVEVDEKSGAFETPPLPAEPNGYVAEAEGYVAAAGTFAIEPDQNLPQDIYLEPMEKKREPAGMLLARVTDVKGRPLAASLVFDPDLGRPVDTNPAKGTVSLDLKPGGYIVKIGAEGYHPKEQPIAVADQKTTVIDVALSRIKPKPTPTPTPTPAPKPPPKKRLAAITENKIEVSQKIKFRSGAADLTEDSLPVLDDIAGLLKEHSEIKKLQIEGHTDSQGGTMQNLRLSDKRAKAVKDYLVKIGVDPKRMETIGFGEDVPIADNSTPEGRARNRRVEFIIIQ